MKTTHSERAMINSSCNADTAGARQPSGGVMLIGDDLDLSFPVHDTDAATDAIAAEAASVLYASAAEAVAKTWFALPLLSKAD